MAAPIKTPPKSELGNTLDLVDVKEIRDSAVVMKDGSLRQIIMVGGVNFALKSDTEQTVIIQGYQNLLNSIDFPLQVVIHSRKVNIEKYIEGLSKRKDIEDSPLLKNQIDEYIEFVRGFVEKNAIMEKVFLVVISFYPAGSAIKSKSLFDSIPFIGGKKDKKEAVDASGKTESEEETEKAFQENLAQISQRTGQAMSGLLNAGLEVTTLENDALIELLYNFYNPQTVERNNVTAG
jgi:type IV secretory pathway VirB4 component